MVIKTGVCGRNNAFYENKNTKIAQSKSLWLESSLRVMKTTLLFNS